MLLRSVNRGRPGSSARRLARRRTMAAAAVIAVAVVGSALAALAGSAPAGLVMLGMGWLWSRRLVTRRGQALAGEAAEQAAATRLRRTGAVVAYDARCPGLRGDIDAVVLGPMVAAIEIKRGVGRVRWSPDGQVRVGRRRLPGRPLVQAIVTAAALRRGLELDDHVDAVLCVTEMTQRPRRAVVNGVTVWVTSARHLRRVVRRLPSRIDRSQAQEMAMRLG